MIRKEDSCREQQEKTSSKTPPINTDKQHDNSTDHGFDWLEKYQWKKGQSGNLNGRPKERTLKEWVREYIANLTPDGRREYLKRINPELAWKMAEGNPVNRDITTRNEPPTRYSDEQVRRIAERIVREKR